MGNLVAPASDARTIRQFRPRTAPDPSEIGWILGGGALVFGNRIRGRIGAPKIALLWEELGPKFGSPFGKIFRSHFRRNLPKFSQNSAKLAPKCGLTSS